MKTRKSTRLLALFLSVLMIITSVPFMTFAADNNQLASLIAQYESAIAGGTIYTSMENAYVAYNNAKKALFENQSNVDAEYTALNNAMSSVYTSYIQPKTQVVTWDDDTNTNNATLHSGSKNVLFAPQFQKSIITGAGAGDQRIWLSGFTGMDNVQINIFYGSTVLLYDGATPARFPIMAYLEGHADDRNKTQYPLNSIYPAEPLWDGTRQGFYGADIAGSTDLTEADNKHFKIWKPVTNTSNGQIAPTEEANLWIGGSNGGSWSNMISANHWANITATSKAKMNNVDYKLDQMGTASNFNGKEIASTVQFYADLNDNQYTYKERILWGGYVNNDWNHRGYSLNTAGDTSETSNKAPATTYVINIKTVRNSIDKVKTLSQLDNVGGYTYNSMLEFMKIIDRATTFDPSNSTKWDYGKNYTNYKINDIGTVVNAVGEEIKAIVEGINAPALTAKADYSALDSAYAGLKNIAQNTYSAKSLEAVRDSIDNSSLNVVKTAYDVRVNQDSSVQSTINNAAADINDAVNKKEIPESEAATYNTVLTNVNNQIKNADNNDKYNVNSLNSAVSTAEASTHTRDVIIDGKTYSGYDYDYDTALLQTALNEAQYLYTVTVKDGDETTTIENPNRDDKKFVYGETVKVEAAEYNSKVKPGRTATWMEPVYIGSTDKIVVRGDTVLTKCAGTGEKVVKFVSGGQVYDIQSTTESKFDLSKANIYAPSHYTVSGYKVGDTTYDVNDADLTIDLAEGTTEVTVLFKADTKLGEVTVNGKTHTFGAKVTLKSKEGNEVGFYANGDHLWNGNSYTFYARETVTIEEGEFSTVVGAHTSKIEPSNGKVYFYGGISNADESNVLSQGMIIELDGEETKELTLAAVDGEHIFNVTAQRIDSVTKQYSISMPENAASKVRCRAYVAYKTTDGIKYVYSNATQVYPAPSDEVTA